MAVEGVAEVAVKQAAEVAPEQVAEASALVESDLSVANPDNEEETRAARAPEPQ